MHIMRLCANVFAMSPQFTYTLRTHFGAKSSGGLTYNKGNAPALTYFATPLIALINCAHESLFVCHSVTEDRYGFPVKLPACNNGSLDICHLNSETFYRQTFVSPAR